MARFPDGVLRVLGAPRRRSLSATVYCATFCYRDGLRSRRVIQEELGVGWALEAFNAAVVDFLVIAG